MNTKTKVNYKANQGILPLFFSDFLNINDPVLVFDKFMEGIDCSKYLKNIPVHETGRIRYNPVDMLKTVLFGFMTSGYMSLRELEDNCRVNIRFMYLMNNEKPSYRTFGYFINEVLKGSIRKIFIDVNMVINKYLFLNNRKLFHYYFGQKQHIKFCFLYYNVKQKHLLF